MSVSFFSPQPFRKNASLGVFLAFFFICIDRLYIASSKFIPPLQCTPRPKTFQPYYFLFIEMCAARRIYVSGPMLDIIQRSPPNQKRFYVPMYYAEVSQRESIFWIRRGTFRYQSYFTWNTTCRFLTNAERWLVPFGTPPTGWGYDTPELWPRELCVQAYTVWLKWVATLYSRYAFPPPLWEQFFSSFNFLQFSHCTVEIWKMSKK